MHWKYITRENWFINILPPLWKEKLSYVADCNNLSVFSIVEKGVKIWQKTCFRFLSTFLDRKRKSANSPICMYFICTQTEIKNNIKWLTSAWATGIFLMILRKIGVESKILRLLSYIRTKTLQKLMYFIVCSATTFVCI